jgi:hypothetical protein
MEINYQDFVPYMVEFGQVTTDKKENVRNCATLCELLDFPITKNLEAKIRRDIKYYAAKSKNRNMGHSLISHSDINEVRHYKFAKRIYTEQANAFLIMALAKIEGKVSQTLIDICDDLYKNLDSMDPQFQLGETLIGLHHVCPKIKELAYWQKWMEKRLEGLSNIIDNIFEYNWQAKYLFEIRKDIPAKGHAEELQRRLIGMKITADMETNYLAVYFEAMMSLWGILGGEEIFRIILPVWILLLQRWKSGLFYFKNGTARIDITGHILSGLQVFFISYELQDHFL